MGEPSRSDRQRGRNASPPQPRHAGSGRDTVWNPIPGVSETIESIVVAFTLALLFRAFEAEAFVIPTGSMAPTLMGRHKDLECDSCGRDFRVGCSQEEDDQSQSLRAELARLEREFAGLKSRSDEPTSPREREAVRRRLELLGSDRGPIAELQARLAGKMVPAARCPNCGNVIGLMDAGPAGGYKYEYPSFSGDRILVDKFAYDFAKPERWDVVVFRYPEDAKTNYIKRLVGLPNETVHIAGGDIWTSRQGAEPAIARKPPAKLLAMLQCVHDSRNVSTRLLQAGWPLCWGDWSAGAAGGCRWSTSDEGRTWSAACEPGGTAMLRYRHFLPTGEDWAALEAGESLAGRARATPVDDFQPYNAIATRPHPVGDLAVEMQLESVGQAGSIAIDLVEDGRRHRCTLDLADGTARLAIGGGTAEAPSARTAIRGRGRWRILFANVDDELSLFVNGGKVAFDKPATWESSLAAGRGTVPAVPAEPGSTQPNDLAPVGVEASLAANVRVRDLRVMRDIYYISAVDVARTGQIIEEDVLQFPLEEDQFFVLGDNSAASKDSRLWMEGHHVDRNLLIGRALMIFWPHAVPAKWAVPVKLGGWEVRLPSWPNFGRMGFVR
jgi:signal peptidase I